MIAQRPVHQGFHSADRKDRARTFAFLASFFALAGCASTPSPTFIATPLMERIPAGILVCNERPVPGDISVQSGVARYVVELVRAGEDCRSKLRAVREIVEGRNE